MKKNVFQKLMIPVLAALLLLSGCDIAGYGGAETPKDDTSVTQSPEDQPAKDAEPEKKPGFTVADKFTLRYNPELSLNPFSGSDADNMAVAGLMYEGLCSVSADFEAEPLLCSGWETENGKNYVFTLKPDLRFTDGSPLTAADVVYSVTRARNAGRFASRLGIVVSTVAVGTDKVSVTLSQPDWDFPLLMDVPIVKDGTGTDAVPVGTGPYVLRDAYNGKYLAAYSGYRDYRDMPIYTVGLRQVNEPELAGEFSTKDIDLICTGAKGAAGYNIHVSSDSHIYDTTTLIYVGFNAGDTVMSDSRIRRGISYIIDREYVCGEVLEGKLRDAPLILSSALSYYDRAWETETEYSLVKMSEIFSEIGMDDYSGDGYLDYPINDDWREFTVTVIANKESAYKVEIGQSVVDSLQKVGIRAELQELPWAAYLSALENGEFDIYVAEAQLQTDFDLSPLLAEGGELNYGGVKDGRCRELTDKFLGAQDEDKAEAAKELCGYVLETAPVIPLAFQRASVVTHRGAVTGMSPSQSNVFRNITEWSIEP